MGDTTGTAPGTEAEGLEVSLPALEPSSQEPPRSQEKPLALDPASLQAMVQAVAPAVAELVIEPIRAGLRPDIERGLQSVKDSRLGNLEPLARLRPEQIKMVAEAFQSAGNDPEKAAHELGLRMLVSQLREPAQPSQEPPAPAPSPKDSDKSDEVEIKARVLRLLGRSKLSDDAQRAVLGVWGKKSYKSFEDGLEDLTGLIAEAQVSPEDFVESAAGITPPNKPPIGTESNKAEAVERLYAELEQINVEPTKNKARRAEIKKRLRELGEEI